MFSNKCRTGSSPSYILLLTLCVACAAVPRTSDDQLLDDVERRTFHFFWDLADPQTQLIPDRAPTPSFSSIAAVGFGLTAYGIGAERGYVTRAQAAERTLATLRSLLANSEATHNGFYYHFLDMHTGRRFEKVELSTIDSALLFAGALFSQSYFDRDDPAEKAIRNAAEELYGRADWQWAQARPPAVSMGWYPEKGMHDWDWRGYNEAMILYILALGSPTHPIEPAAWGEYTKSYKWGTFYGQQHLLFAPLFGHQYSHVWIDFRGIRDESMRAHGIDYFENSRRATLAQHAYAVDNPSKWREYGDRVWGLSACDGPMDEGPYHSYWARGATEGDIRDDGTIAPTAAASSIAFTPELSIAAMRAMSKRAVYDKYGFLDAFNPTLRTTEKLKHGRIDLNEGWIDVDYLGIDEGPIIAMIENYRSGLVWKVMRRNAHVVQGLRRAGFTGGWLEGR